MTSHWAAETQSRAAQWRIAAVKSAIAGSLFLLGAEALIAAVVLAFAHAQAEPGGTARGPLLAALWASAGIGVMLLLIGGGIFRAQTDSVTALPRELHREFSQLEGDIRTLRKTSESFRERHPLQWVVLFAGVTYLVAREWSGAQTPPRSTPSTPAPEPHAWPKSSPEVPPRATAA